MRKADRRAACQRPWARFGPGGTSPHSPAGLRRSPPQPPFTIRWQCGRLSGGSRLAAELSVVGCDCAAMLCTCDMTAMMPAFGSPPETAVKCVRVFQCVYRSPQFHPTSRTGTAPPRRGPCVSFYSGSPRPCPVFSSYRYENAPGGANDNCVNRFVSLTHTHGTDTQFSTIITQTNRRTSDNQEHSRGRSLTQPWARPPTLQATTPVPNPRGPLRRGHPLRTQPFTLYRFRSRRSSSFTAHILFRRVGSPSVASGVAEISDLPDLLASCNPPFGIVTLLHLCHKGGGGKGGGGKARGKG